MSKLPNKDELAVRLDKVDMMLLALLKRRMDLALQVGQYKMDQKPPEEIFRPSVEDKRLSTFRKWAEKSKMNPHFAEALFYTIIGESCKQQMIQLQSSVGKPKVEPKTEEEEYQVLKNNLLNLTEKWSQSYDDDYDKDYYATHAYLEFESNLIVQEIGMLAEKSVALDIGCATGAVTFGLVNKFNQAIGYDISPHMIEKAQTKKYRIARLDNITFKVADVENGISEPDESVSFVVMSLGTAGDIRNIKSVLQEVKRVLKSGGRFLFSFYNRDALLYRWDFIPWPTGLAAEINLHKNCLEVHRGEDVFSVYARAYTIKEVRGLFEGLLSVSSVLTYPTISSILPSDLLQKQPEVKNVVDMLDQQLAESGVGAYILVAGQKSM